MDDSDNLASYHHNLRLAHLISPYNNAIYTSLLGLPHPSPAFFNFAQPKYSHHCWIQCDDQFSALSLIPNNSVRVGRAMRSLLGYLLHEPARTMLDVEI